MRRTARSLVIACTAGIVVTGVAGCGPAADDAPADSAPRSTTTAVNGSADPPPDSADPPGKPAVYGPAAGEKIAVIGIAYTDTLAVPTAPGGDQIADRLGSSETELVATGTNRTLDDAGRTATWYQIDRPVSGWVPARDSSWLGETEDVTAEVVAETGEPPAAVTVEELGADIAGRFATSEPPSRIVQITEARTGELHEVTYDVIGLGDDATLGYRLTFFAEPGPDSVALTSVERTSICARGITAERQCL